MLEPFIGEIAMFGGNFAPRGWALCDGQLLPINSNSALFSILGTNYGGDGISTFGLPDLRGRVAMHAGTGPGLTPRSLGAKAGAETVTLTTNQIPAHSHTLTFEGPNEDGLGGPAPVGLPDDAATADATATTSNTGGGLAHENMPPYLVVNYIIALTGTFPSRS